MKQKELSILLRAIVALCGLVWLVLAHAFGRGLLLCLLEPNRWLIPNALVCLMLALVALAMIDAWRIFARIGQNNSFCPENAKALRRISHYALADTVLDLALAAYTLLGSAGGVNGAHVFLYLGGGVDGQVLLYMLIAVMGVAATVVTATLSHLTQKAASLQDENDLTI